MFSFYSARKAKGAAEVACTGPADENKSAVRDAVRRRRDSARVSCNTAVIARLTASS